METMLQIGIGRSDITPPVGIAHAGWGAQVHDRASGIDHSMLVTVLWASDSEHDIVICDLDLGVVTAPFAQSLREDISTALDVETDCVRISYSHTHAGPDLPREEDPAGNHVSGGQELVQGYLRQVRIQVVGAARAARLDARAGRMAAGYAACDIGINRRFAHPNDGSILVGENPGGVSDSTVNVVRFDDLDGNIIATIIGYAAHPITLAFQNNLISPDYPGFARLWLERLTGSPTLFLQGCAGDQMAVGGLTGDTAQPRNLGKRLASASATVAMALNPAVAGRRFSRVVESGAPLAIMTDVPAPGNGVEVGAMCGAIAMPVRQFPSIEESLADATEARGDLVRAQSVGNGSAIAEARFRAKRADFRLTWSRFTQGRVHADVGLQAMRIGDVGLVGFPGEPFVQIGADVRKESPFLFTQMAGYSNGWTGYVPTDEEFSRGGYEVEICCPYDRGAEHALRDGAVALLDSLR